MLTLLVKTATSVGLEIPGWGKKAPDSPDTKVHSPHLVAPMAIEPSMRARVS